MGPNDTDGKAFITSKVMDPDLILGSCKMDGELVGDRGSSTLATDWDTHYREASRSCPSTDHCSIRANGKLQYPTPCSQDKAKRDSPNLFRPYDLIVCIETGAFRI